MTDQEFLDWVQNLIETIEGEWPKVQGAPSNWTKYEQLKRRLENGPNDY